MNDWTKFAILIVTAIVLGIIIVLIGYSIQQGVF